MNLRDQVAANWDCVRNRMAAACARAGREPASVRLIAVTKYARVPWVEALVKLGHVDLGENRPQQLVARAAQIPAPVRWHLIGPLQRNKVRMTLPVAEMIHSVESWRLLETIDRIAGETGRRPRVLLEVNLTGETAKHGFTAESLQTEWERVTTCRHVAVEGLMTMAAYAPDAETARPVFASLRELSQVLSSQPPGELALPELSMGMSGDFEVAIEEGATMVRIGTALWEGLEPAAGQ